MKCTASASESQGPLCRPSFFSQIKQLKAELTSHELFSRAIGRVEELGVRPSYRG
jgi:hypothetical protein